MRRLASAIVLTLAALGCADGADAPRAGATADTAASAPAAAPVTDAGTPAASFSGQLVRFDPAPGLFRSIREEPGPGCPDASADAAGGAVALTRSHENGLRIVKRQADLATLAARAGFVAKGARWLLPGAGERPADHFRSANWDALYGEWPADTSAAGAGGRAEAHLVARFPRQDGCSVVFLLSGGDPVDLTQLQAALNSVAVVPE